MHGKSITRYVDVHDSWFYSLKVISGSGKVYCAACGAQPGQPCSGSIAPHKQGRDFHQRRVEDFIRSPLSRHLRTEDERREVF